MDWTKKVGRKQLGRKLGVRDGTPRKLTNLTTPCGRTLNTGVIWLISALRIVFLVTYTWSVVYLWFASYGLRGIQLLCMPNLSLITQLLKILEFFQQNQNFQFFWQQKMTDSWFFHSLLEVCIIWLNIKNELIY